MSDSQERRTNPALRQRIDELLDRVKTARAEIVDRGLSAVHGDDGRDATRQRTRSPSTSAIASA